VSLLCNRLLPACAASCTAARTGAAMRWN